MILRLLFASVMFAVSADVRAADRPKPLFHDFMGINGHTVQFRPELYRPTTSLVRDYHPVEWDLGKDSEFATAFPLARNGVNWNQVYGSWRKAGYRIDVSLMVATTPTNQWKHLAADTRNYGERFARAFGPDGDHPHVEAAEIGNEPGKFSDADYRTVFENMARGLRAGDPKLKIVTCNLTTGKSHAYAKSVGCIAGLTNLYDVLNVHSYAQLENWPTWRRSFPEDPRLKDYVPDIRKLCAWRDEHAPDKEVWLTEFGYGSATGKLDPNGDFKQWVGVTDTQQAQWIVRSWLVFATLPIERAYLYFFNDNDVARLHAASGLTRHFQPKPSYYAVAHLRKTLGDYRFHKMLVNCPGDAMLFEFTHASDSKRRIWVAWSPTGNERLAELDLPKYEGTIEKAERMPLSEGGAPAVAVDQHARHVPISESPLYLFLRPE